MNNTQEQHWAADGEQVDLYLLNRMPDEQQRLCADHLEHCTDCRVIIEHQREFILGIRHFGRREMKHRLKQRIQRERSQRFEWTQLASIAAAVVLIFCGIMAIRWFGEWNREKSRQIVLQNTPADQRPLWITGRVVLQRRNFSGTLSERTTSFIIKQGSVTQNVFIHHAPIASLPLTQRNHDEYSIQTLLERTPQGLQFTLYADSLTPSLSIGIEAISSDSLIVFFQGQQIAYHIPGGWGKAI
jgi:hypothetical protein